MKKYQNFYLKNYQFLVVKFSIYLNRRVFVMAIFNRFHARLSFKWVLIICSNGSAPLNKMVAMPIYGKNTLISSSSEPRKL